MALLSEQEVQLRISTHTDGESELKVLAGVIEQLGNDAAAGQPKFSQLAAGIEFAAKKARLLEGSEQAAKQLSSEVERTRKNVQALQTTLSEAYASDGSKKLIYDLSRQLSAAEREAARASEAFDKNSLALIRLKREAQEAGVNIHDLAAERENLNRTATAIYSLSSAFKTLGVKPLQDMRAETERLQGALAIIKGSGIIGADQERAVAAFNEKLAKLRREAGQLPGAAVTAKTALAGVGNEANASSSALGAVAGKAAAAIAAFASFGAVSNIASDVIKTGAAFETLEARLTSLLGSSEDAKAAMSNIKQLAISTPFEVTALSDSFVKLTAFGLQPSMEQMRALADTAATLGGGTEQLAGVTLALGQAWAKGKLQGDEILQLAERGVPVWDVLAQATGKNTTELQKMSEAGELGLGTILKLIDALGKMNAGASEQMMATFSGAVSNAKDALAEFYDMISQAGVLDFLTGQLQDLLAEFERMKQNGELDTAAKRMADAFIAVGEGVRTAGEAINSLSGIIKFSVESFAAWKLAGMTLIPVLAGVGTQATATAAQAVTLAAGTEKAAIGMRAMAAAGRLLKGLTLIGLVEGAVSLGIEFLRARRAAEDGDRAVKKMLEPVAVNGPKDAIKAIATETEAARFKLTEYQRAMGEMQAQGKTTGEALGEMVKKGDFSTVKGIGDFINGLESIRQGVQATGEQIRVSLQERFSKMAAEDLRAFGLMAESAFNRGEISAEQLASTLNGTVDAALKQLGSTTEVFAGGMTAQFMEAAQQVGVVQASFERLQESGQNAGAILNEAFGGALKVATSIKDFEGLEVAIRQAGEAGQLSKTQVSDFLDKIREKVDAVTPGVNSLAEAFKTLGMKSPEELVKVAKAAEEAFNLIKEKSGYTVAELANVQEAFKRYAEAAIAANGGVATDTLRVQAEMRGLSIEVDAAGKSIVKAMTQGREEVERLGEAVADAANQIDALHDQRQQLNSAAPAYGGQAGDGIDFKTLALGRGATPDNVDAVVAEAMRLFDENLKTRSRPGTIVNIKGLVSQAVDGAVGATRAKATTHTINLRFPGGESQRLNVMGEDDVTAMLKILESAGMRSA